MIYTDGKIQVEAFQFSGDESNPGWPEGWLSAYPSFGDDGVYMHTMTDNGLQITFAAKRDFVVKDRGNFFPVTAKKFHDTFEQMYDSDEVAA